MSSSHYVYFGIYLKCTKSKTIEVEGRARCSKDPSHVFNVYHDTHFCPICGSPVERKMEEQSFGWLEGMMEGELSEYINPEEFEMLDKTFYQMGFEGCKEDEEFLIPTSEEIFGFSVESEEGAFDVALWQGSVVDEDKVAAILKPQIDLLEKVLYSKVEIKFGYISQWG